MDDHPFGAEAARLFAVAPVLDGEAAFAEGVEQRLARYARVRGWVLGAAGAAGAALAVRAIVASDAVQQLSHWTQGVQGQAANVAQQASGMGAHPQILMWAALVICAGGLLTGGFLQRT